MAMIVAVADAGNISRAAELVHRSQSAVSMQIKTLEAALGKPLFVRKPRSVVPTQDGEVLLAYARRMLALRDEAWAAVVRREPDPSSSLHARSCSCAACQSYSGQMDWM